MYSTVEKDVAHVAGQQDVAFWDNRATLLHDGDNLLSMLSLEAVTWSMESQGPRFDQAQEMRCDVGPRRENLHVLLQAPGLKEWVLSSSFSAERNGTGQKQGEKSFGLCSLPQAEEDFPSDC